MEIGSVIREKRTAQGLPQEQVATALGVSATTESKRERGARNPEILIFDDSFSALDYKTDAALRKGLAEKLGGVTCMIVAQRIGTIRNADKIVVLDEGKAVGIGTHEELIKNCAVYREIAMSQLSAEELGALGGAL